jgi:hypothetical protein
MSMRPLVASPGGKVAGVLFAVSCAGSGEAARTAMIAEPIAQRETREGFVLIGNSGQSAFSNQHSAIQHSAIQQFSGSA